MPIYRNIREKLLSLQTRAQKSDAPSRKCDSRRNRRELNKTSTKIIYLVGDHFGVEFETFGDVELAERWT